MAYIKTLLCLSVLLHYALGAGLFHTRNGPKEVQLVKRLSPDTATYEFQTEGGVSVKVLQSNLPKSDQRKAAQEVAYAYNKYNDYIDIADTLWNYFSTTYPKFQTQVAVEFTGAAIVQNYYIELEVDNRDYVLGWGV